jgi:hypothetical protein
MFPGGSESLLSAAAEKFTRRGVLVFVSVKDWGKPVEQVEYLRSVGCKIVHRRSASLVDRLSRKLFPLMNPFTSGCHFDDGCGKFNEHCACPQMAPQNWTTFQPTCGNERTNHLHERVRI